MVKEGAGSFHGFEEFQAESIIESTVQWRSFDAEYAKGLASGDTETEHHFAAYFGELLSIKLRSRLRSSHLIEDVKQETFLRVLTAFRQKGGIENPQALGSYVNSVCNNVLLELYRAQSRIDGPPEDRASSDVDAETRLVGEEERAQVRLVLSELPNKDRQLLRWLFFEERNKDEVCRRLKVDREYLRVLVHRAKLRFRAGFLNRRTMSAG